MDQLTLDLTSHRCPLALLLVKRAVRSLNIDQTLCIHITDVGSRHDIFRYLTAQSLDFDIVSESYSLLILLCKKAEPK